MKSLLPVRNVLSPEGKERHFFGFSDRLEDHAHLFWVLRDGLYSNKILAVLREYSANAWDAHRSAGKGDLPIRVSLPTTLDAAVSIRDYGSGLPVSTLIEYLTKYGRSSKRETDDEVGMIGIGMKAGFSYNDSFTVTSWNGGVKTIIHAVIDDSNRGYAKVVHEEPCSEDATGIEVKIPVLPADISKFYAEARTLFAFFRPQPVINVQLPEFTFQWKTESGYLNSHNGGSRYADQWKAVMGCIPYRVNLEQLVKELEEAGLLNTVSKLSGGLYFDINEVMISANREELQYTAKSRKALVEKFRIVVDELYAELNRIAGGEASTAATDWQRRLEFVEFIAQTSLPVPEAFREQSFGKRNVSLYRTGEDGAKIPQSFRLKRYSPTLQENPHLSVEKETRILVRDTIRPATGYVRGGNDFVLAIQDGYSPEDAILELGTFLAEAKLTGVPILRMSEMVFREDLANKSKSRGGLSGVNPAKYSTNLFALNPSFTQGSSPLSGRWEILSDHEPDDEDVFVIISRFTPFGRCGSNTTFFQQYLNDRHLLEYLFGEKGGMPPVLGYKDTDACRMDPGALKGTPYSKWRLKTFEEILARRPDLVADLRARARQKISPLGYSGLLIPKVVESSDKELGTTHPVTVFLRKFLEDLTRPVKGRDTLDMYLNDNTIGSHYGAVEEKELDRLLRTYPLLHPDAHARNEGGLQLLFYGQTRAKFWLDYVRLLDTLKGQTPNGT